ncbi:MAG: cysteine desulfurase [Planctomycetaceae bacterium]|nr:cysteine desulfurase [Planctomycetaceae bacterium]
MSEPSRIYLDHNATTPPFPEVIDLVAETYQTAFANPGSRHAEGRQARRVLEAARESMADRLGCEPHEIIFTSGGTESTNIALRGLAFGKPGTILMTPGDHPASRATCEDLRLQGWSICEIPITEEGLIDRDQLTELPWEEIRLACVLIAHNETGVVQNIGKLGKLCLKHQVPLHVDAVQAVGRIPIVFKNMRVMTLSLGAHKFGGPRGIGALVVRQGLKMQPVVTGGFQEQGKRPGTEPTALIAGMARALEICLDDFDNRLEALNELRDRLQSGLEQNCAPVVINGSQEHRLPNTLNISFPGVDGEALLVALDLAGIACSLGSTCASGSAEPAPILLAMKQPEEVYSSAIRFSVGVTNTLEEMDEAVQRISQVVNRMRNT